MDEEPTEDRTKTGIPWSPRVFLTTRCVPIITRRVAESDDSARYDYIGTLVFFTHVECLSKARRGDRCIIHSATDKDK